MPRIWGLLLGLLLLAVGADSLRGQTPAPAMSATSSAADNRFLAPFIDGQTIAVAHLDAAKIDTNAINTYAISMMDEAKIPAQDDMRTQLSATRNAADVFLARFKQLGGRHVYVLLSHPDLWPHMQPLAVLVKIEPGGDAAKMKELLTSTFGMSRITPGEPGPQELLNGTPEAVILRDNVLFIGQDAALQRLRSLKPVARPELALQHPDVPLEATAALTADERRALSELMPTLPPEEGGGSTEPLTKYGLRAQITLELPPHPRLQVAFQRPEAPQRSQPISLGTAATIGSSEPEIDALITRLRDLLLQSPDFTSALNDPTLKPRANEYTAAIKEILTPSNGTIAIQEKQLRLLVPLVAQGMAMARQQAMRSVSAANLRGIAQAACVYAADNHDMLPESLDVMVKNGQLAPRQLVNPVDGKPYIYRVIIATSETDGNVPLAWEQTDGDHLNVALGDAHVEWTTRQALEAAIKRAEEKKAKLDAEKKAREPHALP